MKRWVIMILFSIVACCPALSAAEDSTFSPGRATRVEVPFLEIPFGSNGDSATIKKNKDEATEAKEKDLQAKKEEKAKAALDKKVDDAIKRACGTETGEE